MVSYIFCNPYLSIENWYEERLAIEQAYRKEPDTRMKRDFDPSINCLNSTGIPQPLKRFNRVPKHDTSQIIPSDGYNEMKTTVQTELLNP
jgi:hypothetical protein